MPHTSSVAAPAGYAPANVEQPTSPGTLESGRKCLMRDRPDLGALAATIARRLAKRPAVVLRLRELPAALTALQRLTLAAADLILTNSEHVARRVQDSGVPAHRIAWLGVPRDRALFRPVHPRSRAAERRLVYVGDLEPEAGVMDLFTSVQAWASLNSGTQVAIDWIGSGCLQGVLDAQPLQPNMRQSFVPALDRPQLADVFLRSNLLLVPESPCCWAHVVVEAMTAGLPVFGSVRAGVMQALISPGETGWLYNPHEPGAIGRSVSAALSIPPETLCWMGQRAAAQAKVLPERLLGRDQRDSCLAERFKTSRAAV